METQNPKLHKFKKENKHGNGQLKIKMKAFEQEKWIYRLPCPVFLKSAKFQGQKW